MIKKVKILSKKMHRSIFISTQHRFTYCNLKSITVNLQKIKNNFRLR